MLGGKPFYKHVKSPKEKHMDQSCSNSHNSMPELQLQRLMDIW